jgi:MarR family 2-MHQ and catechol resistance regulon transcriptional repressor
MSTQSPHQQSSGHPSAHSSAPQDAPPSGNPHHRFPALETILAVSHTAEFFRSKVDTAVAALDITGVQYTILRVLKRSYPKGMSRTEIHGHIIEKSVDITRSIDGLEKSGLVVRSRPDNDRRLSVATITEQGIKALEQVDPMFFTMLQKLSTMLTPEEFQELTRLCKKVMGEKP